MNAKTSISKPGLPHQNKPGHRRKNNFERLTWYQMSKRHIQTMSLGVRPNRLQRSWAPCVPQLLPAGTRNHQSSKVHNTSQPSGAHSFDLFDIFGPLDTNITDRNRLICLLTLHLPIITIHPNSSSCPFISFISYRISNQPRVRSSGVRSAAHSKGISQIFWYLWHCSWDFRNLEASWSKIHQLCLACFACLTSHFNLRTAKPHLELQAWPPSLHTWPWA